VVVISFVEVLVEELVVPVWNEEVEVEELIELEVLEVVDVVPEVNQSLVPD